MNITNKTSERAEINEKIPKGDGKKLWMEAIKAKIVKKTQKAIVIGHGLGVTR
jgi:predicted alpha/beta hydrolase family esterase